MHQKILVALDHSTTSSAVFDRALTLAVALQAELLLLHVLSGEEPSSPLPIPPGAEKIYWAPGSEFNLERWQQQWKQYAADCLNSLHHYADRARATGLSVTVQQIPGTAGHVICDVATNWGADLILIGHRGHSGLKEWLLGSVSNYVVHQAVCSVLTVKLPTQPIP